MSPDPGLSTPGSGHVDPGHVDPGQLGGTIIITPGPQLWADCAAAGAIPARGSSAPPLITAEAARGTPKWEANMAAA